MLSQEQNLTRHGASLVRQKRRRKNNKLCFNVIELFQKCFHDYSIKTMQLMYDYWWEQNITFNIKCRHDTWAANANESKCMIYLKSTFTFGSLEWTHIFRVRILIIIGEPSQPVQAHLAGQNVQWPALICRLALIRYK